MIKESTSNGSVMQPPYQQLVDNSNRFFQPETHSSYHPTAVSQYRQQPSPSQHLQSTQDQVSQQQSQQAALAAVVAAMKQQNNNCLLSHLSLGDSAVSQSLSAALFANSPFIGDNIKLAATAAAVANNRNKKQLRDDPIPQSGFKGVSWNSRMKAWLAFYVTENGERKSKTFSTRKLGMEEAKIQAIAFCKQKQDQRKEARKRHRILQHLSTRGMVDTRDFFLDSKMSSDDPVNESPTLQNHHSNQTFNAKYSNTSDLNVNLSTLSPQSTPNINAGISGEETTTASQASNNSEVAYVPIVPIAMNMIEKSGLLQPLELNILPPCQYCNKQPYPFLIIVSEGQEQTYSGNNIMSFAPHNVQGTDINQTLNANQNKVNYSENAITNFSENCNPSQLTNSNISGANIAEKF